MWSRLDDLLVAQLTTTKKQQEKWSSEILFEQSALFNDVKLDRMLCNRFQFSKNVRKSLKEFFNCIIDVKWVKVSNSKFNFWNFEIEISKSRIQWQIKLKINLVVQPDIHNKSNYITYSNQPIKLVKFRPIAIIFSISSFHTMIFIWSFNQAFVN